MEILDPNLRDLTFLGGSSNKYLIYRIELYSKEYPPFKADIMGINEFHTLKHAKYQYRTTYNKDFQITEIKMKYLREG